MSTESKVRSLAHSLVGPNLASELVPLTFNLDGGREEEDTHGIYPRPTGKGQAAAGPFSLFLKPNHIYVDWVDWEQTLQLFPEGRSGRGQGRRIHEDELPNHEHPPSELSDQYLCMKHQTVRQICSSPLQGTSPNLYRCAGRMERNISMPTLLL